MEDPWPLGRRLTLTGRLIELAYARCIRASLLLDNRPFGAGLQFCLDAQAEGEDIGSIG
jgi:hypothetical protein